LLTLHCQTHFVFVFDHFASLNIDMRLLYTIVGTAAISAAFVIPDEQVLDQIAIEQAPQPFVLKSKSSTKSVWSSVEQKFESTDAFSQGALDNAIDGDTVARKKVIVKVGCDHAQVTLDTQGWLGAHTKSSHKIDFADILVYHGGNPQKPPVRRPARPVPIHDPDQPPDQTVYDLINTSQETREFARYINKFQDIVDLLNGTAAKYTVFAPTENSFTKWRPKNDKELHDILSQHISPVQYDAFSVFMARTIETTLAEETLGGYPQRLRIGFGLGLEINFDTHITSINNVGPLIFPPQTKQRTADHNPAVRLKRRRPQRQQYPVHTSHNVWAHVAFLLVRKGPRTNGPRESPL
jgi:Fasciclin domain